MTWCQGCGVMMREDARGAYCPCGCPREAEAADPFAALGAWIDEAEAFLTAQGGEAEGGDA